MRQLHEALRRDHDLKYGGRMQYGLFLKVWNNNSLTLYTHAEIVIQVLYRKYSTANIFRYIIPQKIFYLCYYNSVETRKLFLLSKGEVIQATNCCNLQRNCCIASWKALLHVLPHTSNIVTQQNFVVVSWSSMLLQVELASTFFNKLCISLIYYSKNIYYRICILRIYYTILLLI